MSDDLIKRLQDAANGPYDMTPICAELLEAADEIKRLREYIVRQHDYFTGKDVPDLIVTTGTDYEDLQK